MKEKVIFSFKYRDTSGKWGGKVFESGATEMRFPEGALTAYESNREFMRYNELIKETMEFFKSRLNTLTTNKG